MKRCYDWTPAFAGVTLKRGSWSFAYFKAGDGLDVRLVIPAQAGIQVSGMLQ